MIEWRSISSAHRDGRPVWVKRVFEGTLLHTGWAVFDYLLPTAPSLHPPPPGLGIPSSWANEMASVKHWLRPNRLYFFPAPTHWSPNYKEPKE